MVIPALQLHAGHVVVQKLGAGPSLRIVLREVRDCGLVDERGATWVLAEAVEDDQYPLKLYYPPGCEVWVLPWDTRLVVRYGSFGWAVTPAGRVCLRPSCDKPPIGTDLDMIHHLGWHR